MLKITVIFFFHDSQYDFRKLNANNVFDKFLGIKNVCKLNHVFRGGRSIEFIQSTDDVDRIDKLNQRAEVFRILIAVSL